MRLLPIMILGLVPLYMGAKLFGILSLCAYRSNIGRTIDWTVIKNSGIVFYGGLISFLIYVKLVFPRYMGKQSGVSQGIVAVCIPLFHGFARIGCYFGRCCYGRVCTADLCSVFFEHRLPTQLIEAAFNFVLFGILLLCFCRGRLSGKKLLRLYLGMYAPFRFCIEFFRDDAVRGFIGPLSFSQWVSVGICLYLLWRQGKSAYNKKMKKRREKPIC